MELQRGVQRWVVDISQWNPSPSEFSYAMSFLPQHEHHSITRDPDNPRHLLQSALAFDDSLSPENSRSISEIGGSKRAIVSRLLQYALVHEVFGIPFDEIIIKRTVEGKPYLEWNKVDQELPNFNFNASHHGDYVAIASEPLCIVGLDIVSLTIPGKETIPEFIQNFSSYFSRLEWNSIVNASSCDDMLTEFYRYWCLKEAFVKAIGTGVGCRLDSVEFHHTGWTNISVKLDGRELKEWRFWLYDFGKRRMVSIARGHPRIATETYKRTLKRTEFDEEQYHLGLNLPNVSFMQRTVEQLIPVSFKSGGNIGQEHDACQAEEIGNSKS